MFVFVCLSVCVCVCTRACVCVHMHLFVHACVFDFFACVLHVHCISSQPFDEVVHVATCIPNLFEFTCYWLYFFVWH